MQPGFNDPGAAVPPDQACPRPATDCSEIVLPAAQCDHVVIVDAPTVRESGTGPHPAVDAHPAAEAGTDCSTTDASPTACGPPS